MGLFNRRRTEAPARELLPVTANEADVRRAIGHIAEFEAGIDNSDARIRSAVAALAQAGGAISFEERVRMFNDAPPIERPWQWLVAVAYEAHRIGDLRSMAHVVHFVCAWTHTYEPLLGLADHMDILLDDAPQDVVREILVLALRELPHLPGSELVVDQPHCRISVDALLTLASIKAKDMANLMPPDLLALARQIAP